MVTETQMPLCVYCEGTGRTVLKGMRNEYNCMCQYCFGTGFEVVDLPLDKFNALLSKSECDEWT